MDFFMQRLQMRKPAHARMQPLQGICRAACKRARRLNGAGAFE